MPLGDKNVWGTLYPIKKKKKVVMLATKVNELWNTNLIQLNLDYLRQKRPYNRESGLSKI